MRVRAGRKAGAIIPTASMADIAFLLIIFFMVTTVHEVDRTSVNLPRSVVHDEAEKGAAIVVLHRDKSGALVYRFSDGKEMSRDVPGPGDIYLEVSRITYRDKDKQFLLKADGELKFALIDELMDQLRKAGATKLLLLTRPKGDDRA